MKLFMFTMHRTGSMAQHMLTRYMARKLGLPLISPNGGDALVPLRQLHQQRTNLQFPDAFLCGPLRGFIDFPVLGASQKILQVRDPRDVLVSMFFSYCYSHAGEIPGNTGYRKEVADLGIDWFVRNVGASEKIIGDYGTGGHITDLFGTVKQRYQTYINQLMPKSGITLLKYEDMALRPEHYVRQVKAIHPNLDANEILQIVAPGKDSSQEDKWAHNRKGSPGDYREKLRPETIEFLNDEYGGILEYFGYA